MSRNPGPRTTCRPSGVTPVSRVLLARCANHTVIHTFPNVSQFWTYRPDDFLKNPVYSRDYPPCKHC